MPMPPKGPPAPQPAPTPDPAQAPGTTPPPLTPRYPDPTPRGRPLRKFKTGARPSPKEAIIRAPGFRPSGLPPTQFGRFPSQLSMWGNDQYGNCTSAEEAWAKACESPEIFVTDADVIAWCRTNNYLDGADLVEVMDSMARSGMVSQGQIYDDGPHFVVDYSQPSVLQSALVTGPVKIAIDHSALPPEAGNHQGWNATGGSPGQYTQTDHCVGLGAYGPASWIYQQLGLALPSALQADQVGYGLFTWSTIGFVDHAWILSTCTESHVRNPTTVGGGPVPGPGPTPSPGPCPRETLARLAAALAQADVSILCLIIAALEAAATGSPLIQALLAAVAASVGCTSDARAAAHLRAYQERWHR